MNTRKLFNTIFKDGGVSYNIVTGESNSDRGFFASIKGREKKIEKRKFVEKDIKDFIYDNAVYLSDEDNFFGAWVHEDHVYLDVSKKFNSKKVAIAFGVDNEQLAIFDAEKKETINL